MKFAAICVLALFSLTTYARSLKVKVTLSPAGDFVAKTEKVRGFVEKNGSKYTASELYVEVGNLKTDIDLRDKHFQERLGGPKAKITLKNAVGENGKGSGILSVNGKSQSVNFEFKEEQGKVVARFAAKPSTFGISGVKYMGVGVEDKVIIDAVIPMR